MDELIQQSYQYLAWQIVKLALKDYKKVLSGRKFKNKEMSVEKLEEFFLSEYFSTLSMLEGTYILRKFREEYK